MACREITAAQAFGIIAERIEKRIQTLRNIESRRLQHGDFGTGLGVAAGAEGAGLLRVHVLKDNCAEAVMRCTLERSGGGQSYWSLVLRLMPLSFSEERLKKKNESGTHPEIVRESEAVGHRTAVS
jgi:hypothetical protein